MIQVSIYDLALLSLPLTFLFGIAAWLFKEWVKIRIDKSIQHEYDKKLEEYRFSQLQRQKAELVARFFARWIKYRGKEKEFLNPDQLVDYYEDLNQMSFEITLWIKDVALLNNIMKRLQGVDQSESIHQLIGQVRKLILDTDDGFDYNQITIWPKPEEMEGLLSSRKS